MRVENCVGLPASQYTQRPSAENCSKLCESKPVSNFWNCRLFILKTPISYMCIKSTKTLHNFTNRGIGVCTEVFTKRWIKSSSIVCISHALEIYFCIQGNKVTTRRFDTNMEFIDRGKPLQANHIHTQKKTRVQWLAFCQPQSRILRQHWVLKSVNSVLSPAFANRFQRSCFQMCVARWVFVVT